MKLKTSNVFHSAERAIDRLIEKCRKTGPLYVQYPKLVAQVSRTGKWLLNAINALRQRLASPSNKEGCE